MAGRAHPPHGPPSLLLGGIVLDPHDAGTQQLQAHAERLGLARVQVFRARLVGKEQTYLVVEWPRPLFQNPSVRVIEDYLDSMAQTHIAKSGQQPMPGLESSDPPNCKKA